VISLGLEDVELSSEDIPGWSVASEGKVTVALDITISDELKSEGIARDVVNRVQNLRKELGLDVQDKINISIVNNVELINNALASNKEYICQETQALSLEMVEQLDAPNRVEIDDWELLMNISVQ
jgi:isoleucyl-tRNA synthetase